MSLGPCHECGKDEVFFCMGLKTGITASGNKVYLDKLALCEACYKKSEHFHRYEAHVQSDPKTPSPVEPLLPKK